MAITDLIHWKMIPLYLAAPLVLVSRDVPQSPSRASSPPYQLILKHALEAIYNLYFHPLRKYPGPKSWAASGLPRILQRTKGNEMWVRLEAHKKYGPVIRMAPNDLSWIEPAVWKDVWAHRQGHQEFMKDERDRIAHPNGHFGILNASRENHSRYRRLLSHAFSEKGMREQQGHIVGYVDMLMRDLKAVADEGSQDMVMWFNVSIFMLSSSSRILMREISGRHSM